MINLREIGKRLSEEDKIRVNNIKNHPKYKPGFEREVRSENVWYEPKLRDMFIDRRTGQR